MSATEVLQFASVLKKLDAWQKDELLKYIVSNLNGLQANKAELPVEILFIAKQVGVGGDGAGVGGVGVVPSHREHEAKLS